MKTLLESIYGLAKGRDAYEKIQKLLQDYSINRKKPQERFSSRDCVLISYGDSLRSEKGDTSLSLLHGFCSTYLKEAFSTIHMLPFFPFSSDDGFSVKDFHSVDPKLGDWDDIEGLGCDFNLMFDFVLNHISAESDWFKRYLNEEPGFEELAIEVDPRTDLSMVTRPRSLPLLTRFEKQNGQPVHVWTTFSADQIDVNYASVTILILFLKILLFYVEKGAQILRLDAIAYLWKKIGTTCIHLQETHQMVKLFRKVLDRISPEVQILTETNVPHPENVSYFGNGSDEAQMVYNFTLPPLMLHAFLKGDAALLSEWAAGLSLDSPENTFFNFSASHDGIGVRPLEGILQGIEIEHIAEHIRQNGGEVSYRSNPDGSESPYELNITYIDALRLQDSDGDEAHVRRFLTSQAIQLSLPGVPAVYIHSILGSRNWYEGVKQTGRARSINREKLGIEEVEKALAARDHFRSSVFFPFRHMLGVRRNQPAFHPNASFKIMDLYKELFVIRRECATQVIIGFHNVSSKPVPVSLSDIEKAARFINIIEGTSLSAETVTIEPYSFFWLEIVK